MTVPDKEFVSQQKFAELRGVSKGTVSKWKQRGFLVLDGETGNVDVSASVAKLDDRPDIYRGGAKKIAGSTKKKPPPDEIYDVLEKEAKGEPLTHADATRIKEIYLARTQKLKYDLESGVVVAIEEVGKLVSSEYAAVRSRLLSIPARAASKVAVMSSPEAIKELLAEEIAAALEELTADVKLSNRKKRAQSEVEASEG